MQQMVEQKFDASLNNPEEDPHKAYVELATMLRNTRPDFVVSSLMINKAGAAESNQEEVTAEVFEDTALRWALRRLAATPDGKEAVIVEEQVFRVLMRSLQATHSAARLGQKLAQFAQEYALPKPTYERIQEKYAGSLLRQKGLSSFLSRSSIANTALVSRGDVFLQYILTQHKFIAFCVFLVDLYTSRCHTASQYYAGWEPR
jgi:hypothetical protein